MGDKLLVALVAWVAALLGSLIPTIVGYLNNKSRRELEVKNALLEKQRQIYFDLMRFFLKPFAGGNMEPVTPFLV